MLQQVSEFPSFLAECYSFVCMYRPYFASLFVVNRHWVVFTCGLPSNAVVNMGVQMPLRGHGFYSLATRRRIAGSYGNSLFNILQTHQTFPTAAVPILHAHLQCTSVPISPHPGQHLRFSVFSFLWVEAICTGMFTPLLIRDSFISEPPDYRDWLLLMN